MKHFAKTRDAIAAFLKDRTAVHYEIVGGLHLSTAVISVALKMMRNAGEVHICEYRRVGYRLLKVYKLGSDKDAPKPERKLALEERAPILAALIAEKGPLTRKDITALGWSPSTVTNVIHFMKKRGEIRVHEYVANPASGQYIAHYGLGSEPDAPRGKSGRRRKLAAPRQRNVPPPPDTLMAVFFGR